MFDYFIIYLFQRPISVDYFSGFLPLYMSKIHGMCEHEIDLGKLTLSMPGGKSVAGGYQA